MGAGSVPPYIASVSFGKDSLAMLLELMEREAPLDEVVFYDTGMEFEAIYTMRDQVLPLLAERGIRYTELKPDAPFLYKMFEKPVNGKNGFHYGYSWCGGRCRWGTTEKLKSLDAYAEARGAFMYVGIAANETPRLQKERKAYKLFPLVEWEMTERQCLMLCYDSGFCWVEGESGIDLYEILDRVSCWCCANKNLRELKNMYAYLPHYWHSLRELQSRTSRPMKGAGKSVFELEARFEREIAAEREKAAAEGAQLKIFSGEVMAI